MESGHGGRGSVLSGPPIGFQPDQPEPEGGLPQGRIRSAQAQGGLGRRKAVAFCGATAPRRSRPSFARRPGTGALSHESCTQPLFRLQRISPFHLTTVSAPPVYGQGRDQSSTILARSIRMGFRHPTSRSQTRIIPLERWFRPKSANRAKDHCLIVPRRPALCPVRSA